MMIEKIMLGSYTRRTSQGIYQALLDTTQKKVTDVTLILPENNPTYLATSHQHCLYTVTKDGENGGIAAYQFQKEGYHFINKVTTKGAPPCYVSVDNKRQVVFSANYHTGDIKVYQILETGGIVLRDTVEHTGNGPHPNQSSSHAHYIDLTPDGNIIVCDLGTDKIYLYDLTADLTFKQLSVTSVTPGSGPRHILCHPTLPFFYVIGELNNSVTCLAYDKEQATLTVKEQYANLSDAAEDASGGAIRMSQDGKFLYTSTRGADIITVFSIQPDGTLSLIQRLSSEGKTPRDFNLTHEDLFLLVGHQDSDNLTLFERNSQTGKLTLCQTDIEAPECVCVLPS